MFGKIAVRNIPHEIWNGLEELAKRHDRSTEAEARYALRSWVEPLMQSSERSARRAEVSARLQESLSQVNEAIDDKKIKPSHIAQTIGEDYAEGVENWFVGVSEPSFKQLEAVSNFLGCSLQWLQHGDGQIFPVTHDRIPENPVMAVKWLLDLDSPRKVKYLHLVRENDKTGAFLLVKQYDDWKTATYLTPYHVSEEIGAGGKAALMSLSVILELLYKYRGGNHDFLVQAYLLDSAKFRQLLTGKVNPISILKDASKSKWWEDFWHEEHFIRHSYWNGWKNLAERIYQAVQEDNALLQHRKKIQDGEYQRLLVESSGITDSTL